MNLFSYQSLILAILAGLVPAVVWLWFWLQEDRTKPEPRSLIVRVFVAGGLGVLIAYLVETSFCDLRYFNVSCLRLSLNNPLAISQAEKLLLLVWAGTEELIKFLLVWLVIAKSRFFDEPVDAMVYMITAAIGFAAAENILFLLDQAEVSTLLLTGNMRFLGANVIHIISSAIVGGLWGLAFFARPILREAYVIAGLITATILHVTFNFLIITTNDGRIFKIFTLLWLLAILIILMFERVKVVKLAPDNV